MCHTEGLHDRAEMSRARCIAQGLTITKNIYLFNLALIESLIEGEIIIIWNDLCSTVVTSELRLHSQLLIR